MTFSAGDDTEQCEGEIVCRGACQMKGYEANPEANRRTWLGGDGDGKGDASSGAGGGGGGWMRTGDKGWVDADGYVFLSGRFKEIINRSAAAADAADDDAP